MLSEEVYELPIGRHLAIDEQGVGLRATWRLDRDFVNLSLWRDNRCTETFRLTPTEAARFINFLVDGLAETAAGAASDSVNLRSVPALPVRARRVIRFDRLRRNTAGARRLTADTLSRISRQIQP